MIFALLGTILIGLMTASWLLGQERTLHQHAESHAHAMVSAMALDIERVLGADLPQERRREELRTALDAALLLKDQATDRPFVQSISVLLDADRYPDAQAPIEIAHCHRDCDACILSEVPLYHPRERLLIGVASFCSSRDFIRLLTRDVRAWLYWIGGITLGLIGLAWLGANRLLRRLAESETNLHQVFESAPFPILLQQEGHAELTHANQAAIDYLALREDSAGGLSSDSWQALRLPVARSGPANYEEVEVHCPDENVSRWALASTTQIRFSGQLSRLISIVDISRLKQTQTQLHREAITDSLTGLVNRRHLTQKLAEAIQWSRTNGQPLSVILFDLDKFKQINDTFGHGIGDDVLSRVAATARTHCRDSDILGRYGGEEFLMILPNANADVSRQVAERIRVAIADLRWPIDPLRVTISGGVSTYKGTGQEAWIEEADRRLYQAKQSGRNRIVG